MLELRWQNNPSGVINNHEHARAKITLGAILGFSILLKDTLTCSTQQPGIKPMTGEDFAMETDERHLERAEPGHAAHPPTYQNLQPTRWSGTSLTTWPAVPGPVINVCSSFCNIWLQPLQLWACSPPVTRPGRLHGWVDVVGVGVIDRRWRGVIHIGWVPTCWVWISCSKPVHTHTHTEKPFNLFCGLPKQQRSLFFMPCCMMMCVVGKPEPGDNQQGPLTNRPNSNDE